MNGFVEILQVKETVSADLANETFNLVHLFCRRKQRVFDSSLGTQYITLILQ